MENNKKKILTENFKKFGIKINFKTLDKESFNFILEKNNEEVLFSCKISESKDILKSNLLRYKLIEGYEAIYSNELGKIECQLSNMYEQDYENLCSIMTDYEQEFSPLGDQTSIPPCELNFQNDYKIKISIGKYSDAFKQFLKSKHTDYVFDIQNKYTLKIELGRDVDHNKAKKIIEMYGISLIFQISINCCSIDLQQDKRNSSRSDFDSFSEMFDGLKFRLNDEKIELLTLYEYEPAKYFLKASTMHELRFYQFLLYYHCLEYFFPNYKHFCLRKTIKEFILKIRKEVIDHKIIDGKLNEIFKKFHKFDNEKNQLYELIKDCFDNKNDKIINLMKSNNNLKKYYFENDNFKKISKRQISSGESNLIKDIKLKKVSERIYDIRCKIVHKKNDKEELYPNLSNFELIKYDNNLLKFIAEEVIINNSQ